MTALDITINKTDEAKNALAVAIVSTAVKMTHGMPDIYNIIGAAERAEAALEQSSIPADKWIGTRLSFTRSSYKARNGTRVKTLRAEFRREADGWHLIGLEKTTTGRWLFDSHNIAITDEARAFRTESDRVNLGL